MNQLTGLRLFVAQDLQERFTGNVVGIAWAVLLPLLQLTLFGLLFVHVFNARAPAHLGEISFLAFLAVGMWPWFAFAEAVGRGATVLVDQAALLGKVAIPPWQLIGARVLVAFLLHGVGFLIVVLVLAVNGDPLHWAMLPALLLPWSLLLLLAFAMAVGLATLHVFLRDVGQIVPYLLTAMMFSAPIFFAMSSLPAPIADWFAWNPVSWPISAIREALLGGQWPGGLGVGLAAMLATAAAGIGVHLRLRAHIEDFL